MKILNIHTWEKISGGNITFSVNNGLDCVSITGNSVLHNSKSFNNMPIYISLYANSATSYDGVTSYDISKPFINNGTLITPSKIANGHNYCLKNDSVHAF